jgi:hypothetical protein
MDPRRVLLQTWHAFAPGVRGSEIAPNGRIGHIAIVAGKYAIALRDEIVRRACGQGLDRESRICRALGGEDAAIADEQVSNVIRSAEFVDDRGTRIGTHPACAHQMRVAAFLHNLSCAGSLHHLDGFFLAG